MNEFKTEHRRMVEAREIAVYKEYKELMQLPGAMSSQVEAHLRTKYGFVGSATIWAIRNRVEKKIHAKKIVL